MSSSIRVSVKRRCNKKVYLLSGEEDANTLLKVVRNRLEKLGNFIDIANANCSLLVIENGMKVYS